MKNISELNIMSYKTSKYWDFGNNILYHLCKNNFQHEQEDVILTKVLFIGRIYAATIERRKNKSENNNDDFYINIVAPKFKNSKLDKQLLELTEMKLTEDSITRVLEVHKDLMIMLKEITDLDKRSFCSKYLHFHLPELFFIYDSRTRAALIDFINRVPKELRHIPQLQTVDKEYATFFCKCFYLKNRIDIVHKTILKTRQLDNLLIETANNKL